MATITKIDTTEERVISEPAVVDEQLGALGPPKQLASEVGDLVARLVWLFAAPGQTAPTRLLKVEEVAELLNTNSQVVYKLARAHELPAVNLGERMLRFTDASVFEFIKRGGVGRAA